MSGDYLAIDLGASGGRVLHGGFDGQRFRLHEIHRFPNGPVHVLGGLHWDVLRLWSEIQHGLRAFAHAHGAAPEGVAVDTWGVDFALLDGHGRLLGNPVHYRDRRTDGMIDDVLAVVPRERLYRATGIQFMQINTLYQLRSMARAGDPQLDAAETLLFTPDLFHYWLTGRSVAEYTIASTSQMLRAGSREWADDLLHALELPASILPEVVAPGTQLGPLRDDLADELGIPTGASVLAVGSHDTASAVAAIPELDENAAFLSSGTWSLLGVEVPEPVLSDGALALDVTNEGGVGDTVRLLKNVAGLWLLQECRRQWRREGEELGWEELLARAEEAEPFRSFVNPGAESFLGPGDMPAAIRAACRASGQPEPQDVGQMVRCCLESLALKYRSVLEGLEGLLGRRLERLHVVGGGSRNHLLNQFTADACRRPVIAGPVEATALGNLMFQAVSTGRLSDVAAGRRVIAASVERSEFRPRHPEAWEAAYERFRRIEDEGG